MKKRFATVVLFLILLSSFTVSSFAHPGRTDSNGGHWNHSTGEYHYHSGKYAGQHKNSTNSTTSYSGSIDWDKVHEAAQEKDRERQTALNNDSSSSDIETSTKKNNFEPTKKQSSLISVKGNILDLFLILFVFPTILLLILLVYYFLYKRKINKIIADSKQHPKDFVSAYDIIDVFPKSSSEVSQDTAEISTPITPNCKSLIPELETNNKAPYLIVGSDIPIDKTYFSPLNAEDPAFVRVHTANGKESYDFPIYKHNQYITLMKGEKIELINCYLNLEE